MTIYILHFNSDKGRSQSIYWLANLNNSILSRLGTSFGDPIFDSLIQLLDIKQIRLNEVYEQEFIKVMTSEGYKVA